MSENESGYIPGGDSRLTVNIRIELHRQLKIMAIFNDTTMGEIIEKLIEQCSPTADLSELLSLGGTRVDSKKIVDSIKR